MSSIVKIDVQGVFPGDGEIFVTLLMPLPDETLRETLRKLTEMIEYALRNQKSVIQLPPWEKVDENYGQGSIRACGRLSVRMGVVWTNLLLRNVKASYWYTNLKDPRPPLAMHLSVLCISRSKPTI